MIDLLNQPLWLAVTVFAACAVTIAFAGVAMAGTADRLADRTGLGEAIAGGLLLGATTSLSGFVTSVSTAAQGEANLALSNAVGGITAQTFFLAIADVVYRKANLEHAAASVTNLMQGTLLTALLSLSLVASFSPAWQIMGCHPATILIVAGYLAGMRLASRAGREPLWGPVQTAETRPDIPDEPTGGQKTIVGLLLRFALLAAIVGTAGFAVGQAGLAISAKTGLSQTIVGALFTAVSTSLPELITTLSAVRRGALVMAVGGILGGNTFDVLLVAASDVAYPGGSIFHAVTQQPNMIIATAILMTAVLLLGLLRRERHGFANIGFESVGLIVLYGLGSALLLVAN